MIEPDIQKDVQKLGTIFKKEKCSVLRYKKRVESRLLAIKIYIDKFMLEK